MPTPALPTNPMLDSLAAYPQWFVAACLTVVLAASIWLLAKVLKGMLYLLITIVLVGGASMTAWLLMHRT